MIDYLIVGQGLAGSCLAMQLISAGKKVLVLDTPAQNRSSLIAAGLFNPITGKAMSRTWMAPEIFNWLHEFYPKAEQLLNNKFFYRVPVYRPFLSVQEQNEWMAQSADVNYRDFIETIYTGATYGHQVHDHFGGMVIKQSGYVDVPAFLEAARYWLQQQAAFEVDAFNEAALQIDERKIEYGPWQAAAIVFCTGTAIRNSTLWRGLPVQPLKGETLTIKMTSQPEQIYNRGVYIVPSGPLSYKVGATYEAHNLTEEITEAARMELEQRTRELLRLPFEIVAQEWGVRPTSPDRRPMLGRHPEWKNVLIFNGLGTKGVSLAPYFATQMAQWLVGGPEIISQVNIKRFKALYSKP
ncbi:MAG: FAD-dependent oxidoreductase [Cyclobacteriaceae bacterium]|nr:FAD-dependent oxidoreductase [Cyclobacteriaceae bacterium]